MDAVMDALRNEANACRHQDDQKHVLIDKLMNYVNHLAVQVSDTEKQLGHQREFIELRAGRIAELKKKMDDVEEQQNRHAFALVVIDGDNMPFRDELVKGGLEGGKETARCLRKAILEHLKEFDIPPHLRVMIRVYANLKGLAWAYGEGREPRDARILTEDGLLDAFVRGFNMGDPLCDFVDAGNGKECADEKVKACFEMHTEDVHCRYIFFGASADSGYARLLDRCLYEKKVREKTILMEGPSFVQELRDLAKECKTATFPAVFRDQKLPTVKRRVSSPVKVAVSNDQQTSATTKVPVSSSQPAVKTTKAVTVAPSGKHATSINYASVAVVAPAPSPVSDVRRASPIPSKVEFSKVLRNSKSQRVDARLSYTRNDYDSVKQLKLCNSFHLLGSCPYFDSCYHEHDENKVSLTQGQKMALRAVARLTPCYDGLLCDNPNCILGHRCTRSNCVIDQCKFDEDMHHVDKTIVN